MELSLRGSSICSTRRRKGSSSSTTRPTASRARLSWTLLSAATVSRAPRTHLRSPRRWAGPLPPAASCSYKRLSHARSLWRISVQRLNKCARRSRGVGDEGQVGSPCEQPLYSGSFTDDHLDSESARLPGGTQGRWCRCGVPIFHPYLERWHGELSRPASGRQILAQARFEPSMIPSTPCVPG